MGLKQFVVFTLGKEEYGIDIEYTQEIIRIPQQIIKMPNMPSYVEGVVSLREKVVPVIDLKKRFGLPQTKNGVDSRLLILNANDSIMGTIVDDVSEVLMIDEDSVEAVSSEIAGISGNSVKGIGKIEARLIILLDAMKMKKEMLENI